METSTNQSYEPSESELGAIGDLLDGKDIELETDSVEVQDDDIVDRLPETEEAAEPAGDGEEPQEAETEVSIDYDLEIPMPDGREAMKLGELKDKVIEVERTRSELDRTRAEILEQQQLMGQYLQAVGEIPQEFKEQADRQHQQYLTQQHHAMLAAIPEFKDNNVFEAERPKLAAAAKSLGFSDQEIGQIADARLVLALKRLADYEAREQTARETAKQVRQNRQPGPKGRKPGPARSVSDIDKLVNAAKQSNNDDDKFAAIGKLLEG